MDDARIEIRMSQEMKRQLQALAKSGSMTVGGYIKSLIQREIENSKGTSYRRPFFRHIVLSMPLVGGDEPLNVCAAASTMWYTPHRWG